MEFDLSEARDSRYLLTKKVTFEDCLEATRERMEEQWQASALEAVQKAADILAKDALDSLLLEKSREEIPELLEGIQKVSEAAKKSA
ncbi:hypothetical protein ACTMPF_15010, partial [Enterococcus faecium]|uniref:hypothetical protein n=1 Tax=Enterococcus faecium TaxID=1352 RepID=UPI003F8A3FCA